MKKLLALIFLIPCLILSVYSLPREKTIQSGFEIPTEWKELFDNAEFSAQDIKDANLTNVMSSVTALIKQKMNKPLIMLAQITALLIFAFIAHTMSPKVNESSINTILDVVVTLAVFGLCAPPMLNLIEEMAMQVEKCKTYLGSFVPIFSSILVSCGQPGSAAIFCGFFLSSVTLIAVVLCRWALPFLKLFLAINIIGCINDTLDFAKLAQGISKCIKWILAASATIFATILGLQNALAQCADSITLKTGKMIISAGVPVIGKAVSDAISTVYSGLKLLKGGAAAAIVGVVVISFVPLMVEGAIYCFVLMLSSAIASTLGIKNSSKLFDALCETISLGMLFVLLFAVMMLASTILMVISGGG